MCAAEIQSAQTARGHHRSFGDVGSMSGLPESGSVLRQFLATAASPPLRRLNRAEQRNKLHPFIWRRTGKCTALGRATVIGDGIRQRA